MAISVSLSAAFTAVPAPGKAAIECEVTSGVTCGGSIGNDPGNLISDVCVGTADVNPSFMIFDGTAGSAPDPFEIGGTLCAAPESEFTHGSIYITGSATVEIGVRLDIGDEGLGNLTVDNGSIVNIPNSSNSDPSFIGAFTGATGLAVVKNGSQLNNNGRLTIGDGGFCDSSAPTSPPDCGFGFDFGVEGRTARGVLIVESGGSVTTDELLVGNTKDATGDVLISGASSSVTVDNVLSLGRQGDGSVLIERGGSLSVTSINDGFSDIAGTAGSQGSLTVRDPGSSFSIEVGFDAGGAQFPFDIGRDVFNEGDPGNDFDDFGQEGGATKASFNVLDGAQATVDGRLRVGGQAGSASGSVAASLTVSGAGSVLDVIADSATLDPGPLFYFWAMTIGEGPNSTAIATVSDGGTLNVKDELGGLRPIRMGRRGPAATLNVVNGGTVNTAAMIIGHQSGLGAANTNVVGNGSLLAVDESLGTNNGDFVILRGIGGPATLNVARGGTVDAGAFIGIGHRTGSKAITKVDGAGSLLRARGKDEDFGDSPAGIAVGSRNGTGYLEVTGGGEVLIDPQGSDAATNPAYIVIGGSGSDPRGKGAATVRGADSRIRIAANNGHLAVGRSDRGTLSIFEGGAVVLEEPGGGLTVTAVGREEGKNYPISGNSGDGLTDVTLPDASGEVYVDGVGSELDAGDLLAIGHDVDLSTATVLPGGRGLVEICNGGTVKADTIEVAAGSTLRDGGIIDVHTAGETQVTNVNGELIVGCSLATVVFPGVLNLGPTATVVMEIDETGASDQIVANTITVEEGAVISVTVDENLDLATTEVTLVTITSEAQQQEDPIAIEISTEGSEEPPTVIETSVNEPGDINLGFDESGGATVFSSNITIDVKPGSDDNSINLDSAGVIPVAIVSLNGFDARRVNPATIELNGAQVKLVGKKEKALCHQDDIDGNGSIDLVCQVETQQFLVEPGADTVTLTAETFSGSAVSGQDYVTIINN